MHFFNPVPVMGLVELIRGLATSDATVARVEAFAKALGKEVVHANDAPGFIVNRILLPMLNEACFALGEGVGSAADIVGRLLGRTAAVIIGLVMIAVGVGMTVTIVMLPVGIVSLLLGVLILVGALFVRDERSQA